MSLNVGHSCFHIAAEDILVWYSKHDHASAIMLAESLELVLLVGSIGHSSSCYCEQHSSSPTVTGILIILQTGYRLDLILRFNEHQLILQHFLEYLHFIPLEDHMFHIFVACEVAYHPIRHRCAQLNDEVAVVSDVALVVSLRELAAH